MPKPIEIERDFNPTDLRRLAADASDLAYARRLRAIALIIEGNDRFDVARKSGVGVSTLRLWIRQFNANSVAGLRHAVSTGRPAKLTDEQKNEVAKFVGTSHPEGDLRLTDIAKHIREHHGISYNVVSVGRLLKKIGFTFENGQWRERRTCRPSPSGDRVPQEQAPV